MPNKPTIVQGNYLRLLEERGVSPDFSDQGLTKGDAQVLFDVAHEALGDTLRVAPADLLARLPSAIPLYGGKMPGARANVELGLIQNYPIARTQYAYEQTIPDILGIVLNNVKPEAIKKETFLESIRSTIRHELLHILTHKAVNVHLRSVTESVVARLAEAHFGVGFNYGENSEAIDENVQVISLSGGFRSPDGTQILYRNQTAELLYKAASYSLEQVEATELWEIVRRLTAIADRKKMYPLYRDIRATMQAVLSKERTKSIEDTPAFRKMKKGNYALALYDGEQMSFSCISVQNLNDCSITPFEFQPYRHSVTEMPSVGLFRWQVYEPNKNCPLYEYQDVSLPPQFRFFPKKLIETQMRQCRITEKIRPIDRMEFSLYENTKSPHPFCQCEIQNPLGIR